MKFIIRERLLGLYKGIMEQSRPVEELTFYTEKGSKYIFFREGNRGRTIRYKAFDDIGEKEKSDITIFITKYDMNLSVSLFWTSLKNEIKPIIFDNNKFGIAYKKDNKVIRDSIIDFERIPTLGLYPLEIWYKNDKYEYHVGHKIVKIEL